MRVAFDIAQTAAERAGCAWYADGLARALAHRPDIELQTYTHFGDWLNTTPSKASRIDGATSMLTELSPDEARTFWCEAATSGLPGRPEIVHSNSYQAPAVAGSRLVFTIHDLSYWSHPQHASETTRQVCQRGVLDALERAAGIIFVSQATRSDFESFLPGWLARTGRPSTVIPGASRFPTEPRTGRPDGDAPWLCVGSIEPRKNHTTLLEAYAIYIQRVASPRPLHLVGGAGWHSERIHRRIQELRGAGGVHYAGYASESELAQAYRHAFALIQPSWHEGFGLPVVEASGFGVPALCSDIASLREVASDSAVFFPAESAEALAAAMVSLHTDDSLHAASAASCLAISRRHGWDQSAARAVAFYKFLMG